MASAAVIHAKPVKPPVEAVVLTLSHEEAVDLMQMCGSLNGTSGQQIEKSLGRPLKLGQANKSNAIADRVFLALHNKGLV